MDKDTERFAHDDSEYQAGYREGITIGKLSALQSGFDQAFASSVHPSRRLGQLRGRAASLLALLKFVNAEDRTRSIDEAEENLRTISTALNRIKRTDILPPDKEAEEHAKMEHGDEGLAGGDTAMTEEVQQRRQVEALESALEGMGSNASGAVLLREEALLDEWESKLVEIEALLLGE